MYTQDQLKEMVAKKAVDEFVRSGMVLGLGTGSTANFVVLELGKRLKNGELQNIVGVPTSEATKNLAKQNGVPVLDELPEKLDLTIDGADRINLKTGDCVKGWGGAHYIEKRIAKLGSQLVIIVDESKLCEDFNGTRIPLEVDKVCLHLLSDALVAEKLGFGVREYFSDSGNNIVDVIYDSRVDLLAFHDLMIKLPGVLDTGIFSGLVSQVVVSRSSGEVDVFSLQNNK